MLTVAETADALRCSRECVRQHIKHGLIRAIKRPSPNNTKITRQSRVLVYADSVAKMLGQAPAPKKSQAFCHRAALAESVGLKGLPGLDPEFL